MMPLLPDDMTEEELRDTAAMLREVSRDMAAEASLIEKILQRL